MGDVEQLLASLILPDSGLCSRRVVAELCEAIHLHYHDLRLELDKSEFCKIAAIVSGSSDSPAFTDTDCADGVFVELAQRVACTRTRHRDLATVELLRDGTLHIHYRDARLECTRETFEVLAALIATAHSRLLSAGTQSLSGESGPEVREVPLDQVNTYDMGHAADSGSPYGFKCRIPQETQDHVAGIQLCMALIRARYQIYPIAVTPISERDLSYSGPIEPRHRYQRLDGFKRFAAARHLGHKSVPCIVYHGDAAYPGNQRYAPWFVGRSQSLTGEPT